MTMLIDTYQCLLADVCDSTRIHLDAPVDLCMSWVLIEGPKLDKQLLQYIEHGETERPSFPEWIKPLFEAFVLNQDPGVLRGLRQLLVFCYKAELEPTSEQRETATEQFLETDRSIDVWDEYFKCKSLRDVMFREARKLISRVIYKADWSEITPSHGPGAVFPPSLPRDKSNFTSVYAKIQQLYPYDKYFCGLPSFWWEVMVANDHKLQELESISCNLVMVPKDSRGPRLICVHPKEAIWIQQGQRSVLERCIRKSHLTVGSINLNNQLINGALALDSSKTREFVTLDLKEASDRISLKLVQYLFGSASAYLESTRAENVVLPDGRVHSLRKFAPMGNCLTFPVQSLLFWAIVRASIRCHYGIDCSEIFVFGDDIIYPSKYHTGALRGLIRAGVIPNMTKTFRHGFFRESCGVEAFKGVDITPYRMKVAGLKSYSDAISLCSLAKRLRIAGYERCASGIYSKIRKRIGRLHLSNNPDTQGLYEYVSSTRDIFLYEESLRFNRGFQRWETRFSLLAPSKDKGRSDDWYHLQDSLIRIGTLCPSAFSDRGTEYTVPYRERLTNGWTRVNL
jgi:hypothetical protein